MRSAAPSESLFGSWVLSGGAALLLFAAGCDEGVGEEGTRLREPLSALSGGVVYATAALDGAKGYDLFWSPFAGAALGGEQGFVQLTDTDTNDTQPAIAPNGQALAFAREGRGIYLVDAGGLVSRVTDTSGTRLVDSLPAVSADADRIAWVREDRARPIGRTGFFETEVWVANADGTSARPANPRPGVVQDAPAFEPLTRSTRLAWSELDAASVGASGPTNHGVWLHDLDARTGRYICRGSYQDPEVGVVRCFGQHLAWPERDRLVLGQQLLEIDPIVGPVGSLLARLLDGLGDFGAPDRTPSPSGFFPPFPLSVSFRGDEMIVDGVFRDFAGNEPTLAFFGATADAFSPARLRIATLQRDLDRAGTAGFLFSLATPQLVP